jgi:pyrimidine operon attenuation protein / uracil phosphoribosyltransferase
LPIKIDLMQANRRYILDESTAAKKLERMAFEIAEQHVGATDHIFLVGIQDHGVVIAQVIAGHLKSIFKGQVEVLELGLDKRVPTEIRLSKTPDFNLATVIIVDDVSNSGKTMLYALKPFLQYHPAKIQTAALVERSHKAFPVHTDYVGISLASTEQEHIYVEVSGNRITGAYLV